MPSPRNFSPLLPDHVRPCRVSGYLAVAGADSTVLRTRRNAHAVLNPSALLVWTCCDGNSSIVQIEQRLREEFPELHTQADPELRSVIIHLCDLGVVHLSSTRPAHPVLRTGFSNFGPQFRTGDNYFAWMLAERFDVLIVDPAKEPVDLLLFSDQITLGFGHEQVDAAEVLKIHVAGPNTVPDPQQCDFAFASCPSPLRERGDQLDLPGWAQLIDWTDTSASRHALSLSHLLQPQSRGQQPRYLCGVSHGFAGWVDGQLMDLLHTTLGTLTPLQPAGAADFLDALSQCRFALVAGDPSEPEAAATQLLYALYSNALPIYCGTAPVPEAFNQDAFIDCNRFASLIDAVEHINRVNNDADLYSEYSKYAALHESITRRYAPDVVCEEFYRMIFAPEEEPAAVAEPAPARRRKPLLTIGMATYDDYDGVYFSTQAIRMFHPEVSDEIDILLIDNNPDGVCASALEGLGHWIEGFRRIEYDEYAGTAVRDLVFREADTDYVLCIDSHVLLQAGGLAGLIAYFKENPRTNDLLQGPLVADDLKYTMTHLEPVWRGGMFGTWGSDERGGSPQSDPFEIPMQGLGVFACRRDAWLGFNPRFTGFGGEEGYIHEKFRQSGRRTICLPALRWVHRFNRPFGHRYPGYWADRIRNYLIGFTELGLDTTPVVRHFTQHLGAEATQDAVSSTERELASPFHYFDAIYCINLDGEVDRWRDMQTRFKKLGIAHRVRRFSAVATPSSQHIGCALSHRRIIERAQKQGLKNVLVFEDDAIFLDGIERHLRRSVAELQQRPWQVFYLGGHRWGRDMPKAPGCEYLEQAELLTCTHAVAYHESVYPRILADIPADVDGVDAWRQTYPGIDQYLCTLDQRYLASPVVASQPSIQSQEAPGQRDRFS